MGSRGRKSAASLSLVTPLQVMRRPDPPPELTPEQADVWREVVSDLPGDWFAGKTHSLLAQLCRHAVSAKRVAQLIAAAEGSDEFDIADYDRLLKMQERESRCLASLSVKLRISQSTTYDKSKKKPAQTRKPWEDQG